MLAFEKGYQTCTLTGVSFFKPARLKTLLDCSYGDSYNRHLELKKDSELSTSRSIQDIKSTFRTKRVQESREDKLNRWHEMVKQLSIEQSKKLWVANQQIPKQNAVKRQPKREQPQASLPPMREERKRKARTVRFINLGGFGSRVKDATPQLRRSREEYVHQKQFIDSLGEQMRKFMYVMNNLKHNSSVAAKRVFNMGCLQLRRGLAHVPDLPCCEGLLRLVGGKGTPLGFLSHEALKHFRDSIGILTEKLIQNGRSIGVLAVECIRACIDKEEQEVVSKESTLQRTLGFAAERDSKRLRHFISKERSKKLVERVLQLEKEYGKLSDIIEIERVNLADMTPFL